MLLPLFLEEFYPEEKRGPDSFTLYHYNGLVKNGDSNPVTFIKGNISKNDFVKKISLQANIVSGEAVILEGMSGVTENNQILETLQTKWKNIAVDWTNGVKPSIN